MLGKMLFNPKNELTLTSSDGWDSIFTNFTTNSGEVITPEGAFLNLGHVFSCVTIRSNSLAKLPLHLFKKTQKGRERDSKHSLAYLLEKRPNKHQTPTQFKKFYEASLLLWGNAFIKLDYDNLGKIRALIPLEPSKVNIVQDKDYENFYYKYTNKKGKVEIYAEDEILHVPYVTLDGKVGKAPLTVARENAGNLQAIQKFEGNFYKNGTMTKGALTVPSAELLERDKKTAIQKEWMENYGGTENTGKIAILDAGLKWESITMPLKDAEFVMSKRLNQTEIANIFNVPEFMLNNMEKATFNNFEQMKLLYAENVLIADCIAFEEETNYKAFTRSEQSRYFVKFNINSAMRGDIQTRTTHYKEMLQMGVYTIDEIRKLEDMNSIGEWGDRRFISRNFTTLETIEQNATGGGEKNEESTNKEQSQ